VQLAVPADVAVKSVNMALELETLVSPWQIVSRPSEPRLDSRPWRAFTSQAKSARCGRCWLHTPGRELVAVTPGNREDYLYDDIIDLDLAQREHRRFVAVLERFAQVYEVRTLLTELVARPDVREFLVTARSRWCPRTPWPSSSPALSPKSSSDS